MTTAAEEFVLAHEFSHILNGDFEVSGISSPESDNSIESRADLTASEIVFTRQNWSGKTNQGRNQTKFFVSGIMLFFGLHQLLTEVGEQYYNRPQSESHPRSDFRSKHLLDRFEKKFDQEILGNAKDCCGWWRHITPLVLNHLVSNEYKLYRDLSKILEQVESGA